MSIIRVDDQINLVPLRKTSAYEIFQAIDSNRSHLREWLPFVDYTKEVTHTEQFIHSVTNSECPKKEHVYEIRKQGMLVGLVVLKEVDLINHKTEIGYWMIREAQGKGIMTACCRSLINHAFSQLEMNRIQIKTAVGNTRSSKIPQRLGFAYEGTEKHGELLNGVYVDLEVYRMLRSEWR
jgi:ribosomal-protein-serine acetyltransferase